MSVPFRFDTVLRIRESERDVRRQALAQEQARELNLRTERDRVAAERSEVLNELRTLHESTHWTAPQALARRNHAEQLGADLAQAEAALQESAAQLTLRRQELLEADSAVKALEKLAERHHAEQTRLDLSREERERDDFRRTDRAA